MKLKPCPFCGGTNIGWTCYEFPPAGFTDYRMVCGTKMEHGRYIDGCGATTGSCLSLEDAKFVWNRRLFNDGCD